MVGRDAETAVCMNMSKMIVRHCKILSTTMMTKLVFTLDSAEVFGISIESLRILGRNPNPCALHHEINTS